MALGLNKIVLASASTNTPGAYWQLTTLTGNNSTTVVPAGTYLLFPTANVTIEAVSAYNTNTACATPSTWSTLIANNAGVDGFGLGKLLDIGRCQRACKRDCCYCNYDYFGYGQWWSSCYRHVQHIRNRYG